MELRLVVALEAWMSYEWRMSAIEIMDLIRREPREVILEIGDLLDDLRGDLVDGKVTDLEGDWDRQIEADAMAGKLDRFFDAADKEFEAGKCVEL